MSIRTLFNVLKYRLSPGSTRRRRRTLRERISATRPLRLESLEERRLLAFLLAASEPAGLSSQALVSAERSSSESALARGAGLGGPPAAPAFRLDVVALHEFGHSLGLSHSEDTSSIMYAYYNAGYDTSNLANDSAVPALLDMYADVNTSGWNDLHDADGGVSDGDVDLTYSFVPDGVRMDRGGFSTLYATFDGLFGVGQWQTIFAGELTRWAAVSGGRLSVQEVSDEGLPVNYRGEAQNDPNSGDIRIGAHRFDTTSKLLAHAWFPPPNGYTLAGDADFDQDENWVLGISSGGALLPPLKGTAPGGSNSLMGADMAEAYALLSSPQQFSQTLAADSTMGLLPASSLGGQSLATLVPAKVWCGESEEGEECPTGLDTYTRQTEPEDDAFADPDLLDPAWLAALVAPDAQ